MQQEVLIGESTSSAAVRRVASAPSLPEQSRTDLAIAVGLFFATLLLLWRQVDFVSMNPDEGIVLQGAARILRGEIPYRDFFSFYTPGSYYLLALAFKLFGDSLLVGRAILLLYGGIFSAMTYLLARRIAARRTALFVSYLVLAVLPFRFLVLHNWDSTLWALVSLYCGVRLLDQPGQGWSFALGWFASLAFLTEQSKGFGLALGLIAARWIIARRGGRDISRRHWAWMASGVAIPLGAVLFYFSRQHAVGAMLRGWLWPLRHYSAANMTPYGFSVPLADAGEMLRSAVGSAPSLAIIGLVLVALVVIPALPVIAALSAFLGLRQDEPSSAWGFSHRVLVVCVTTGLLISVFATRRPDINHMIYISPLCLFLLADLPANMRSGPARKCMAALSAGLFVLAGVFGVAAQWNGLVARRTVHTRRGTVRMGRANEALAYIQAHVAQGDKLLVHPYSPLYAFLADTYSPTRFEYLQAGMHTPEQFQQAAQEIAADRRAPVLLELDFASSKLPSTWPSTPAHTIAHDAVAEYVLSHYRGCAVLNGGAGSVFLYMTVPALQCPH